MSTSGEPLITGVGRKPACSVPRSPNTTTFLPLMAMLLASSLISEIQSREFLDGQSCPDANFSMPRAVCARRRKGVFVLFYSKDVSLYMINIRERHIAPPGIETIAETSSPAPLQGSHNFTPTGMIPMFTKVNTLPGAQCQLAVGDRNGERRADDHALYMRGGV